MVLEKCHWLNLDIYTKRLVTENDELELRKQIFDTNGFFVLSSGDFNLLEPL